MFEEIISFMGNVVELLLIGSQLVVEAFNRLREGRNVKCIQFSFS